MRSNGGVKRGGPRLVAETCAGKKFKRVLIGRAATPFAASAAGHVVISAACWMYKSRQACSILKSKLQRPVFPRHTSSALRPIFTCN